MMITSFNLQDNNPEQGVPAWLVARLGKMVQARVTFDESGDGYRVIPRGRRGLLLRICTKHMWGVPGVYCTVAFDLCDTTDETNVEISQLAPFDLARVRG